MNLWKKYHYHMGLVERKPDLLHVCRLISVSGQYTVNSEMFTSILFSQIALKDIFAT